MKKLFCSIAVLATLGAQSSRAQELVQAPYGPGGTWVLYELGDGPLTWVEALEDAQSRERMGVTGDLVSIHSRKEQDILWELTFGANLWIGATDREGAAPQRTQNGYVSPQESIELELGEFLGAENVEAAKFAGWAWTSGEPFTYHNWANAEPNNWDGNAAAAADIGFEDVAEIWANEGVTWNDAAGGFFEDEPIEPVLQPGTSTDESSGPMREYVIEYRTNSPTPFPGIDEVGEPLDPGEGLPPDVGGPIQTVVINTGIDTTLAAAGLGGPDAPHGEAGSNPDGVERWEWDGSDGGGENHGLLWFDIPANTLNAFGADGTATLALHVDNNGNAGNLHRMTVNWLTEGNDVTWNSIEGGPGVVAGSNAQEVSNATFPDSIGMQGQVLEVDVSTDVRAWAAGESNYGWGILPVAGDGHGITSFENTTNPVPSLTLMFSGEALPALQAGDADQDLDFDQLDLVAVQIAGKYLSGNAATWGEGDWNGAPGGSVGSPPAGNGLFDQLDIIAALNAGVYLTGPYAAVADGGVAGDGQTSVVYNPGTGELSVDAPAGTELTSINIDSAAGIFTGDAAANLGGSFDNDADGNIFKATFGGSFGSVSFGNVAQTGLAKDFVLGDLTVVGSLNGGGDLGAVDLIYVPEPSSIVLMLFAFFGVCVSRRRR